VTTRPFRERARSTPARRIGRADGAAGRTRRHRDRPRPGGKANAEFERITVIAMALVKP